MLTYKIIPYKPLFVNSFLENSCSLHIKMEGRPWRISMKIKERRGMMSGAVSFYENVPIGVARKGKEMGGKTDEFELLRS